MDNSRTNSRRGKRGGVIWRVLVGMYLLAFVALLVSVLPWLMGKAAVTESYPLKSVMGTEGKIVIVVTGRGRDFSERAWRAAESELRKVEAIMSVYLEGSEISRFNTAPPKRVVPLSPMALDVLKIAREVAAQSGGVFDVTCRPLLQLWKRSAKRGRVPTTEEIRAVRQLVGWERIRLYENGAEKLTEGVELDLGGIAKGYAIDRAVEAMRKAGVEGGLVNVGGDIRCFGRRGDGKKWRVGVRDPFNPDGDRMFTILEIDGGAVCTSGNYFRYAEIDGRRYSHIVDPRTGAPVDAAASVTVVAPTATVADAWATALSVLGPAGFEKLPKDAGIEVMMVLGTSEKHHVCMTKGFERIVPDAPAGEVLQGQTKGIAENE